MSENNLSVKSPASFDCTDVDVIQHERVFDGFFKMDRLRLRHKQFAGGWGPEIVRELLNRGPAVAAVLYDPVHDLIGLVEQFRVGCLKEPQGPWALEVVAGILDCGGTPEEAMRRELIEEADIEPRELRYICDYMPSPGGCDEKLYLYCAIADLTKAGGIHGLEAEGEDIKLCIYTAKDVFANLYGGRMNNAATLICLQWLQLNHAELKTL